MNSESSLEQISLAVYQAVIAIQKQRPEWIVERHRAVDLQLYQPVFVSQLRTALERTKMRGSLAATVQRFLQKLFVASFFKASLYRALIDQLEREFLARSIAPLTEPAAMAILLLDAENIKLTRIEEAMLSRFSSLPIKTKIAFANWRSMGKFDLEFHQRGYQMIHVPTGKNAADLQMTAIGASLFLHYPHAKEVFVCSGDAHLITLSNLLQSQGWKVFALRKRGTHLTLTDWTNGRIKVFTTTLEGFNPKDELEQKLAKLLIELTTKKPGAFINVGVLASHFKNQYGESVTEVMRNWKLGSHYVRFLQSCSAFKLQQVYEGWQIAIRPIQPGPIASPSESASTESSAHQGLSPA